MSRLSKINDLAFELTYELMPLNRNEAIKVMAKTISEETMQPIGMEEAMRSITNAIKQKKAKVLGIDRSLCS